MVIQTEELEPECAAWLAERCELVRSSPDDPKFDSLLTRADGLVVRSYTVVDAAFLDRAPKLRVVGRAGVGLDSIDLPACAERGVRVVHTPGANTQAVVELVFAMVLDVLRPRVYLPRPVVGMDAWRSARRKLIAPRQLGDLTLGILGFGRIGSRVAEVGRAFGMRVIYFDIDEQAGQGCDAERVSRDELFEQSDVLSVHVDGRPDNRHLLGTAEFGSLKPDVIFVNASRGFVVDPFACADFMIGHPKAQALLDVHEPEPFDATYPLVEIKNVHLTPHIGGSTAPANLAMSWVVRDVWRVLDGQEPEFEARA